MRSAQPEPPPATPCYEQLAQLLAESREDTTAEDWRGAMLAAQTVGWRWERIFAHCGQLLQHGEGPRELRDAVRYLPKPRPPRGDQ